MATGSLSHLSHESLEPYFSTALLIQNLIGSCCCITGTIDILVCFIVLGIMRCLVTYLASRHLVLPSFLPAAQLWHQSFPRHCQCSLGKLQLRKIGAQPHLMCTAHRDPLYFAPATTLLPAAPLPYPYRSHPYTTVVFSASFCPRHTVHKGIPPNTSG